jgi:hypothetical protein
MNFLQHARSRWKEFACRKPGERFQHFHEEQGRTAHPWTRPLYVGAAIVTFVVGIILVFIPGPAVVFFAATAALLAAQSSWIARHLDRAELQIRAWLHRSRSA